MWAGEDSNLHPLRDRFLKPACIPVSPPAQTRLFYTLLRSNKKPRLLPDAEASWKSYRLIPRDKTVGPTRIVL